MHVVGIHDRPKEPEPRFEEIGADAVASKLYRELSDAECREAVANLRRYFEIALAIAEEHARLEPGLTQPESVSTMKERSHVDLKI